MTKSAERFSSRRRSTAQLWALVLFLSFVTPAAAQVGGKPADPSTYQAVISGKVTNSAGQPVGAVRVGYQANRSNGSGGFRTTETGSVQTGSDGAYTIVIGKEAEPADGYASIVFEGERQGYFNQYYSNAPWEYHLNLDKVKLEPGQTITGINASLHAKSEVTVITGKIMNEAGEPLSRTRAQVDPVPWGPMVFWIASSDTNGDYTLLVPPSKVKFPLRFGEGSRFYEEHVTDPVSMLPSVTHNIDVVLKAQELRPNEILMIFEGRVTDRSGQPLDNVGIKFASCRGDQARSRVDGSYSSTCIASAEPGPDIAVGFDYLGEDYIDAWYSDAPFIEAADRITYTGIPNQTITGIDAALYAKSEGVIITGTVSNEAGEPIGDVSIRPEISGSTRGIDFRTHTAADGSYSIALHPGNFVARLKLFSQDGYQPQETDEWLSLRVPTTHIVDIVMIQSDDEPGPNTDQAQQTTISGQVTSSDGTPVVDTNVSLTVTEADGTVHDLTAPVDSDGRYEVTLPPLSVAPPYADTVDVVACAIDPTGMTTDCHNNGEPRTTQIGASLANVDIVIGQTDDGDSGLGGAGGGAGDAGAGGDDADGDGDGSAGGATGDAGTGGDGGAGGGNDDPGGRTGGGGAGGGGGTGSGGGGAGGGGGDGEGGFGADQPSGRAWGDVHLRTIDGTKYDFQAVGEFVALRSAQDDFEIQLRMEPVGRSQRVSINTAIAIRVGADRINITAGSPPTLQINGAVASANQEKLLELQGGGRIEFGLKSYAIHLPDGSSISVTARGSHLNAYLSPAAARAGTLSGLLGNFDGNASNDLLTADGRLLEAPVSSQQIYDEFGASWRVSQDESLFDYVDGQTTATFADLEFPHQPSGLQDLSAAERQRAEKICRDTGISNAEILEGCIVDVGHSGDQVFAESALDAQAVDAEAAGIGPKPIVSGRCEPDSSITAAASYRANVARTGRTESELRELEGTVVWAANRFRSNKEPIYVDGKIIATRNNRLAALDATTGEIVWETEGFHGRIAGRGLLAAGGAVFAAWNDAFAAYDLGSGDECWHLPVTTPTSATFAKNRLFIGVDEGATGYVAAIDARNGQMLWRHDTQNSTPANWSNPSEPALDNDMLFFADGDDLVALDAATGSELWRSAQGANVSEEIAADDGVIYVPLRSLGLEAIDAATGKTLWSWRESRAYIGSPAIGHDLVYVSDWSHLHAIDRDSGTVVWSSDEQQPEKFASPTLAGNRLFTASTSNELVVLDAGSGKEVQRLPLTHRGSSYPVVPLLADGRVYLVLSGVLQAYE